MPDLQLDPSSTALVLIDLQRGIVAHPLAPYPAAEVVGRGDRAHMPRLPAHQPPGDPAAPTPRAAASELGP